MTLHATLEEVFALAAQIASDWDVIPVLRYERPYAIEETTPAALLQGPADPHRVMHVDFVESFDLVRDMTPDEYRHSYNGRFFVEAGERTSDILRASRIAGLSDSDADIKRWNRLRASLRRRLHIGAVVTDSRGQHGRHYSHAYTDGALQLARSGVRMLDMLGNAVYHFDLLQNDPSSTQLAEET